MKSTAITSKLSLGTGLAAILAVSACQAPPNSYVRDTGNMAYPAPLPQGNVATTGTGARMPETGSVAFPAPLPQGNVSTVTTTGAPRRPTDTGNMAYPAPLPAGTVGSTTLSR